MEKKMIEALNRTIKTYKAIYNDGNRKLAEEVFAQFMAQIKLVEEVTGKKVNLIEVKDGYEVILK